MVHSVQPVGRKSALEPARIEPAPDRAPLASSAVAGPQALSPPAAPATIVQLSDAVFARQRGVMAARGRGQRRLDSADGARAEADALARTLRGRAGAGAMAQAHTLAERVSSLLFE
jgi:hypothetical protein